MLTVCAWCEHEAVGEAEPEDRREPVSHGICERHEQEFLKELHERRQDYA